MGRRAQDTSQCPDAYTRCDITESGLASLARLSTFSSGRYLPPVLYILYTSSQYTSSTESGGAVEDVYCRAAV